MNNDKISNETKEKPGLVLNKKSSVLFLPFSDLEYVEVIHRTIHFHLVNGKTEQFIGSLSDMEPKLLLWPDFIKVHRSYLVNIRCIQRLESNGIITHTGHSIPIAKRLYGQIKTEYLCKMMEPSVSFQDMQTDPMSFSEPCNDSNFVPQTNVNFSTDYDTYHILLVDDEEEQLLRWSTLLQNHGCIVTSVSTMDDALQQASHLTFDCILLDVMLGNCSGFDVCKQLTTKTKSPILFLSSLDDNEHQIQGFQVGGCDYLSKKLSDDLFWLKVQTRIQLDKTGTTIIHYDSLTLDMLHRKVVYHDQPLSLTSVEYELLSFFIQNPEKIFTPLALFKAIWGDSQWDGGQTIQMHLFLLDRKLREIAPANSFLHTVWGKGYRFSSTLSTESESTSL